jgi:hypothetical protein
MVPVKNMCLLTIDGVGTGNWIYWSLTSRNYRYYNTTADFRATNHSTLLFSAYFHQSSLSVSWHRIYYRKYRFNSLQGLLAISCTWTADWTTLIFSWNFGTHLLQTTFRALYKPRHGPRRKHSSYSVACVSVGVPTWSLPSQSIGALAAA